MTHFLIYIIYLAFVSLGLPDAILGAAWPTMYPQFEVPVSYAGAVSTIISVGTVISSLLSDRINRKLSSGKVVAISTGLTALALFGFSMSRSYWQLCLWAIPYGLGAGSIDACLNNYVAIHYESRHMNWLHCMWGLGASAGPYVMGFALTGGMGWRAGYQYIAGLQAVLTFLLLITLPLWKQNRDPSTAEGSSGTPLKMRQVVSIPGVREVMVSVFSYCAVEQTTGLWIASFLVMKDGLAAETAAKLAGIYFVGITLGRGIGGFATKKLTDIQLARVGEGIMVLGIAIMLLPFGYEMIMVGTLLSGIGGAPLYPCLVHSIPAYFGENRSQAVIGVLMAAAFVGCCAMPPVFGLIAQYVSVGLLPVFLAVLTALMVCSYERLNRICGANLQK